MDVSYYGGTANTAVHTDIGSVLATDPTWSSLPDATRKKLASSGVPLWHALISYLEPHVLLWSTARSWLDYLQFPPTGEWSDVTTFPLTQAGEPRKHPIRVEARWHQLGAAQLSQ